MGSFSIVTGNGFTGNAQRCVRSGPYTPEPNSHWGLDGGDGFVQWITGQTSDPYDSISWTLSFKYRASDTWGVGQSYEPGAQISFGANTGNATTGSYTFSVGTLNWNYNGTYWFCRVSFTWFGHLGDTGSWIEIDEVSLSSGSGVSGASGTSGSSGSSGNSGGSGSSGTSGSSGVSGGSGSSGSSGSSGVSGGVGSSGSSGSSGTSGAVGGTGTSGSSGTSGAGAYESDNYRLQYYDSSVPNNRGSSPGLNYLAKKDLVVNSGVSINQTNWAYGDTALHINQTDLNQPFFRFKGTFDNSEPITVGNLTTHKGYSSASLDTLYDANGANAYGWSFQGMLNMRVGEGISSGLYWIPFYTWYQNPK